MSWDTHSDRANWFLNYLDKTPKDRFYLLTEKISLDISSSCAHEAWVGILKWSDAVCPHLPSAAWGFWRITSLNPSVALMSSSGIILPTTLGIIIQPGHLLFWFVYVFFLGLLYMFITNISQAYHALIALVCLVQEHPTCTTGATDRFHVTMDFLAVYSIFWRRCKARYNWTKPPKTPSWKTSCKNKCTTIY